MDGLLQSSIVNNCSGLKSPTLIPFHTTTSPVKYISTTNTPEECGRRDEGGMEHFRNGDSPTALFSHVFGADFISSRASTHGMVARNSNQPLLLQLPLPLDETGGLTEFEGVFDFDEDSVVLPPTNTTFIPMSLTEARDAFLEGLGAGGVSHTVIQTLAHHSSCDTVELVTDLELGTVGILTSLWGTSTSRLITRELLKQFNVEGCVSIPLLLCLLEWEEEKTQLRWRLPFPLGQRCIDNWRVFFPNYHAPIDAMVRTGWYTLEFLLDVFQVHFGVVAKGGRFFMGQFTKFVVELNLVKDPPCVKRKRTSLEFQGGNLSPEAKARVVHMANFL